MKLFIAGICYPLTVPVVGILVVVYIAFIEKNIGFHTWIRTGDIDVIVGVFIIGVPIFVLATMLFLKIQALGRSMASTHFLYCFLIYVVAILGGFSLLLNIDQSLGLAYAYGVIIFLCCILAIVCNALIMYLSKEL